MHRLKQWLSRIFKPKAAPAPVITAAPVTTEPIEVPLDRDARILFLAGLLFDTCDAVGRPLERHGNPLRHITIWHHINPIYHDKPDDNNFSVDGAGWKLEMHKDFPLKQDAPAPAPANQ